MTLTIDQLIFGPTIGSGFMSSVILVKKDDGVNVVENFALKMVKKEQLSDEYLKRQMKFECSFQKKLNHPNIVKLYESFENDASYYYLLTELCEKQCLSSIKSQLGSLPLPTIACLASQIVEALTYLRSEFCIHCDIKPENCYVARDNVVKLGDFGSARHIDDQFIVDYNNVLPYFNGTLCYMSPDALCGSKLTYAEDIWGFGCTLFFLQSGHNPFKQESDNATVEFITRGILVVPKDFDSHLGHLIRYCLQKSPDCRLGSSDTQEILKHDFFLKYFEESQRSRVKEDIDRQFAAINSL